MRFILTRHGETVENQKKILQGHIPGKLSPEGIRQAKKLALRLKDEKFDCAYSSDLARAADTAKIIMKYHKKIPLLLVKDLREFDLKKWTGKPWTKNGEEWARSRKESESPVSVRKRVKRILEKAYACHPKGCVLMVSHSGSNKVLISLIMGSREDTVLPVEQKNTAINIFEIKEDEKHKVYLINCTKHLD